MSMARRVVMREVGEPEVMHLEGVELEAPGEHEVRVRQTAIGFNYIDVYQRQGKYPLPLPSGLGHEAAGVVEAVGSAVSGFAPGDRVAYMNAGIGAYADVRNVAADRLVPVPGGLSDEQAAAVLFKGLTAQYLLRRTHRVQAGQTVLVHAAAGGVGQILCRWAKALGATVLATAGSPAKCELARRAGADVAVDYSRPDWVRRLLEANGHRKADVVYDSVGRDTFEHSLDCAAPFGLVVLYGAASGRCRPSTPSCSTARVACTSRAPRCSPTTRTPPPCAPTPPSCSRPSRGAGCRPRCRSDSPWTRWWPCTGPRNPAPPRARWCWFPEGRATQAAWRSG